MSVVPAPTVAELGPPARELYRDMLLTRRLDEECVALQRQGVFPAYAPLLGQEAAQVGAGSVPDLSRDFAFPTYRELGVAVAMRVDPVEYLATHLATWHGGMYDADRCRFAPINAVVGGPVAHAAGWAMGAQLDGTGGVALACFGDGASSEGDVHEAMNFAALHRLPVVFFCQNNQWAISVPNSRQVAGGSVAARAAGYGIPGERVDGNDVLAVRAAVASAFERARAGEGPAVVEALTYRRGPHSTSDDPARYRSPDEQQDWPDPVPAFARRLVESGELGTAELSEMDTEVAAEVDRIREALRAQPPRPGAEMFSFVYREPTTALLEQQRSWEDSRA